MIRDLVIHNRPLELPGRVLLVDDDVDICGVIEFKLASLGYRVLVEHDGEAGLATARLDRPDVIVLDWTMPRLAGIEVCAALRSEAAFDFTPIIVLTAKAQVADVDRAFAAGATDYFVKPFSPQALALRIERLFPTSQG